MSIEINWSSLLETGGDQLSESIRLFLDQRFKEMSLPSYLKSISVTSFDLGRVAPDIVIQRISDPFPEFYEDASEEEQEQAKEIEEEAQEDEQEVGEEQEEEDQPDEAQLDPDQVAREDRLEDSESQIDDTLNDSVVHDPNVPNSSSPQLHTTGTPITHASTPSTPSSSAHPPAYDTSRPLIPSGSPLPIGASPGQAAPPSPSSNFSLNTSAAAPPETPTHTQYGGVLPPASGIYSPTTLQYIRGFRSPIYSTVNMQSLLSPIAPPPGSSGQGSRGITSNNRISEYAATNQAGPGGSVLDSLSTAVTAANTPAFGPALGPAGAVPAFPSAPPTYRSDSSTTSRANTPGPQLASSELHIPKSPIPPTPQASTSSASSSSSAAAAAAAAASAKRSALSSSSSVAPSAASAREMDVQLDLHIMYKGDIRVGIETTLLLNYPSPKFVSLPLKLTMSGLEINSLAALAYIDRRIHFSFICDADADGEPVSLSGKDRVEIIKDIKIDSEIGDREGNGPVLRNVGKIERFLLERLRHLARDELAWPGWITIEI